MKSHIKAYSNYKVTDVYPFLRRSSTSINASVEIVRFYLFHLLTVITFTKITIRKFVVKRLKFDHNVILEMLKSASQVSICILERWRF